MFPSQAEDVITSIIDNNLIFGMERSRWEDFVESYAQSLIVALWLNVQRECLRWIDANLPEAWFREMFK